MNDPEKIYNRLARIRTQHALSRDDLAAQLSITPQMLGYIELGKHIPTLELALRISSALATPLEQIFALTPFDPPGDVLV